MYGRTHTGSLGSRRLDLIAEGGPSRASAWRGWLRVAGHNSGASMEDHELEQRGFATRAAVIFLLAAVLILGLLARFADLQMFKHHVYSTRSDENRIQVQPIPPDRGLIYDRWGVLLADNRPIRTLAVVVERVDDLDAAIADLGSFIDISDSEIAEFDRRVREPRRPYEPVALKVNLTEDEVARIKVDGHRWGGLEVVVENLRYYPLASLMVHAVGSVRRINEEDLLTLDKVRYSGTKFVGRFGVEQFYERSLHGEVGYQHVETDVRGRVRRVLNEEPAVAGQNLTLHLDSRLQTTAHAALGERRGAVVALDPRSGGILALVSNPGYDPNPFITGIPQEEYRLLAASAGYAPFQSCHPGNLCTGVHVQTCRGSCGAECGRYRLGENDHRHGRVQAAGSVARVSRLELDADQFRRAGSRASAQGDLPVVQRVLLSTRYANRYRCAWGIRFPVRTRRRHHPRRGYGGGCPYRRAYGKRGRVARTGIWATP